MRVLAVGAHPDDLELGCGGALARHIHSGDEVTMLVLTDGRNGPMSQVEDRRLEQERAAELLGARLAWGGFADGRLVDGVPLISTIDRVIAETEADVVYGHSTSDNHQDHRAAGSATRAAARGLTTLLVFCSPSTFSFQPTVFVDIEPHLDTKMAALHAHMSQVLGSDRVEPELVMAQARHFGGQARVRFAEGFEAGRFLWNIDDVRGSAPSRPVENRRAALIPAT